MTNDDVLLGLDAGASSCKWAILNARLELLAQGRTAPITGHVFTETQRHTNYMAIEALASTVGLYKPVRAVAGITGLSIHDAAAQFYQEALTESLGLADIAVMSDMDLAYLAHFEPGEGILVYAGTGGIAYHLKADGRPVRAGGRGYLIADPGGGFSIGQQALRFVTTYMDISDIPERHPLVAAVYAWVGSSEWTVLREHVYSGGRSAVAAFAPLVGEVAAQGNADAVAILEKAGQEIADLANRIIRRVGVLPIALAGGALEVSEIVIQSAKVALGNLEVRVPKIDIAQAAAKMAQEI